MYVFSIDTSISYKGSQSISNMSSKVTAVHGNDTVVPCCTAESDFRIKNSSVMDTAVQLCRNLREFEAMFEKAILQ
jgi:hypothetical protein